MLSSLGKIDICQGSQRSACTGFQSTPFSAPQWRRRGDGEEAEPPNLVNFWKQEHVGIIILLQKAILDLKSCREIVISQDIG